MENTNRDEIRSGKTVEHRDTGDTVATILTTTNTSGHQSSQTTPLTSPDDEEKSSAKPFPGSTHATRHTPPEAQEDEDELPAYPFPDRPENQLESNAGGPVISTDQEADRSEDQPTTAYIPPTVYLPNRATNGLPNPGTNGIRNHTTTHLINNTANNHVRHGRRHELPFFFQHPITCVTREIGVRWDMRHDPYMASYPRRRPHVQPLTQPDNQRRDSDSEEEQAAVVGVKLRYLWHRRRGDRLLLIGRAINNYWRPHGKGDWVIEAEERKRGYEAEMEWRRSRRTYEE